MHQNAESQVQTAPAEPSATDERVLAAQVRDFLRRSLVLLPKDLPADFPFSAFKGAGSGSSQVVALPFQLSGAAAPASGVRPLIQSFIGLSGFAVAVSKEYVTGLIDIEAIRAAINGYSFPLTLTGPFGISASVTYTSNSTSGPTLPFQSGKIQISGQVALTGNKWWSPNGTVSFTQLITLALDASSKAVSPVRAGDPSVDQSLFMSHDIAVSIVRSQIDSALGVSTPAVRQVFNNARGMLIDGLNTFDPSAIMRYTAVDQPRESRLFSPRS